MAENSPLKQTRAFHPYGRVKSPLKPSQQTVQPLPTASTIASKVRAGYFSFSGGSSSLFPKTSATSRSALAEVPTVGKTNTENPATVNIFNKAITRFGTGAKATSFPTANNSNASLTQSGRKGLGGSKLVTAGGIRPSAPVTSGKPLRGSGFIPVQRSFKIWGDADSNSNSMEFADEAQPSQPKDIENKTDGIQSTSSGPTTTLQHSKSVRKNLFQQTYPPTGDAQQTRGILTERKQPLYDYPEYLSDIYDYFLDYERRVPHKAHYMSKQEDITHSMRCVLVDWLVEVGVEYGLQDVTIFVAVGYVDRFLSKMAVARTKLQLVGIAAMYIAAKCHEVDAPSITDAVEVTDETFSKDQILIMEGIMLRTLNFDLLVPTTYDFLGCLGCLLGLNSQVTSLALYLAELSLVDGDRFLKYSPSVIATAAVALSRYTHEDIFWDAHLELHSQVKYPEIRPVCSDFLEVFYGAPMRDLTAVYEKYKSVRYNCVSYSILKPTLPPFGQSLSSVSFTI